MAVDKQEKYELRAAAQSVAPLALKTLVSIMKNKTALDSARITAAKEILDRAYGKSVQGVYVDSDPGGTNEELTDSANRFTSAIASLASRAGEAGTSRDSE